jgi:L-ascorbate metabolism protein UlaG (beta-lactamase superfamily)
MTSSTFKLPLSITHIGTATAIIQLDNINLLTDPVFSPAGGEWVLGRVILKNTKSAAMTPADLPPIDAVLLSHEDHPDNLDEPGRLLLDGRVVFTTLDGAKKLAPRSGVCGLEPWETIEVTLGGREYKITATPCVHLPGGECTGFVLTSPDMGAHPNGLPNAFYFSGDTVYVPDVARQLRERFHISFALLNIGRVMVQMPDGNPLQITMDGKQAARLFREIGADVLVPMHYESWQHFTQNGEELAKEFQEEGLMASVIWLEPGVAKKLV